MKRVSSSSNSKQQPHLLGTVFELVDAVVELYLGRVIRPFVTLHEKFYSRLNVVLRNVLDTNARRIPAWFTANFITYFRTALVVPTLLLVVHDRTVAAAFICLAVDFGDFLDGVVARYWVDAVAAANKKKQQQADKQASKKDKAKKSGGTASPTNSDDDSFEVVTTGSPHSVLSWVVTHRNRTYGGFVDAVCDKAYVIPTWIILLSTVPSSAAFHLVQYLTLVCLVLAETASGSIRFRAYFSSPGVAAPKVEGFDFSNSSVKADSVGKAKQTFEMLGTSLFLISITRYLGLLLLVLALPLAYESVRRKIKRRVVYAHCSSDVGSAASFDHRTVKFWMQAKGMGSKLIVGIPGDRSNKTTDMVLNACSCPCVDEVILEAPTKVDLLFLEKQGIDFVVASAGQAKYVTDEVINENCCLTVGEDGVARPMKAKTEHKD